MGNLSDALNNITFLIHSANILVKEFNLQSISNTKMS